jgi:hypothetical protein
MITKIYTLNRTVVARFVRGILVYSDIDFQSITITRLEKSEDYSVSIVIDMSSVNTVESLVQICLEEPTSISLGHTPAG